MFKHFSPSLCALFSNILLFLIFGCAGSSLLCGLSCSCSEWGLLSRQGAWASHWDGFSRCGAQVLGQEGLSSCDFWALEHRLGSFMSCGIFQIRDGTHVSCIGRLILYQWAHREAPLCAFLTKWKHNHVAKGSFDYQWPLRGNFWNPSLKVKLDYTSSKISTTEWKLVLTGILRLSNIIRSVRLPLCKIRF